MPLHSIVSATEQKLLSTFALLIGGLYFTNLIDKTVGAYNLSVSAAEASKANFANGAEQISFGVSCYYTTPLYEFILGCQFLIIPLIFYCLSRRKTGAFVYSALLTALALSGYMGWLYRTFLAIKFNRSFNLENTSLRGFLFFNSTSLEFILVLALAALFVLQLAILTRSVAVRLDRKNYLS